METILQKLFFEIISLFVLEATLSTSKHWQRKGIIKIEDLISDNNELIVKNNHRLRELNILPLDAFRLLALTH